MYADRRCSLPENNLQRAMQEWLCTSKAEMTREAEARSWDETTGNVWHRLAACDHLLDINSWKNGDPPPGQGISFATATRQTPANSKETHRGDSGHLSPTPRSTPNLERHLERTMGVAMVGGNGSNFERLHLLRPEIFLPFFSHSTFLSARKTSPSLPLANAFSTSLSSSPQ
jgi:hypothetical protein